MASNYNTEKLKLQSIEGEIFEVEREIFKGSILEGFGSDEIIPLPNISTNTLKLVIQWATHHKDDHIKESIDDPTQWDEEFLDNESSFLFNLILAANYLNLNGLLNVTCKKVANMIKGQSTASIREIFKLENNFTPEEVNDDQSEFETNEP